MSLKIGKYRVIDMVNPLKWWAAITGHIIKKYVTIAYCEQVVYRTVMCSPCIKSKQCKHCGCDAIAAALSPVNYCSQGNYGSMMSEKQWEDYKNLTAFRFEIKIGN